MPEARIIDNNVYKHYKGGMKEVEKTAVAYAKAKPR